MKRALFVFGIALSLAGLGILGYALYANVLADALLHVTAGMIALGAIIAAFVTDPKPFLALLDRIVAWKKGGSA